jgi:PST family polysaccharide transporter
MPKLQRPNLERLLNERPLLGKLLRNAAWLVGDKVVRLGTTLLVTIWMARYLGPDNFGVFNYSFALVTILSVVAALGLDGVTVRDCVNQPNSVQEILGTAAAVRLTAGAVAWAVGIVAIFLMRPDDRVAQVLASVMGVITVTKVGDVVRNWLEVKISSKYGVFADNTALAFACVLRVVLILMEAPLVAFAYAAAIEAIISCSALLFLSKRAGISISEWSFSGSRAITLLKSSFPFVLSSLTIIIYMRIDQIMVGDMVNDHAAGIYAAAVRISEMWYFVPLAIVSSAFPVILATRNQDSAKYYKLLEQLCAVLTVICLVAAAVTTLLSDWIVETLFGSDFAEAAPILTVHIWCGLFVAMGHATGRWFIAENYGYLALRRNIIGCAVNILLNLVMIPKWGGLGAAFATLCSQAIATYLSHGLSRRTRPLFFLQSRALLLLPILKRLN